MRKKILRFIFIAFLFSPALARAQFEAFQDSVVQLYGVVMTADSLVGIPSASIIIKGQGRGTLSNPKGVFSIVVLKGDQVEFSSIGFKPITVIIPKDLKGNNHSIVQLMVADTQFLPATILRPRPTREQFERDFLNNQVPDDEIATAKKNNDQATRRFLLATMPADAREASSQYLRNYSAKLSYSGQVAPQNIFNPFAWNEFIKAWKRGDFKRKSS